MPIALNSPDGPGLLLRLTPRPELRRFLLSRQVMTCDQTSVVVRTGTRLGYTPEQLRHSLLAMALHECGLRLTCCLAPLPEWVEGVEVIENTH